ncbi:MAG: ribose 5-phosphate isomerase B [Thermodesulfovibrionales bacterium]|nr:ribose 5-phosphate isomerase B [Thermodesulfovibrionales bacterium]
MRVAIGSDHAGFQLKEELKRLLNEMGHECIDFGPSTNESVDYPDFGEKVSLAVSTKAVDRGVLICGTGIGMSIVANKFPEIRASLCNDLYTARMARLHNDANVLVIGGRIVGIDLAKEILKTWFTTEFEGGRHLKRLEKIKSIEERYSGWSTKI